MSQSDKSERILSKAGLGLDSELPLQASDGGIEELRKDIQRLMDMEAIRQVKYTYFRCIDTANWSELSSILHPELYVNYIGGGYEFDITGRDAFLDSMKHAFHNQAVGRHNGLHPEIQMLSESEATGIWYLYDHFWALHHKHLTHGTALYWDRYEKHDGRWLIRDTRYERIYQVNESLTEPLNLSSHYLGKVGSDPVA